MDGIRRARLVAAGIVAASLFATTLPAFAAPALNPPTGVTAAMAPSSTTTVRVTWKDVTREIGYTVERSLSATTGFAALSPQAPQNAVSYDDPGRSPGTTYFYRVRAVGQKNATSPYSAVVSVQVPAAGDTSPPAPAPTVSFTNVSCNTVTVSWAASSDPQSGIARYELTRNGGPASVVSAPSSRTDTGLAASTTYSYTVKAINGAGLSTTGTGSVTTPVCPRPADTTPPTPAPTVSFTNVTCNGLSVDWTASGDPESGINHYELIRNGGAPSTVTAPGSRNDSGLAASTTYSYTVKAINGANLSTSGSASVTTPACPPPSGNPGDTVWTKTGGGSGYETSHGVAVDGASNTIIVGSIAGPATFGSTTLDSGSTSNNDVLLAKYNPAGAVVWAKKFGGSGSDIGYGVAVDRSANCDGQGGTNCIVITGSFQNTVNFGGGPLTSAGYDDIFLAKYSASGAPLWSKAFGYSNVDSGQGVAVDAAGNVFLTGAFAAQIDFGGGWLTSPYFNKDAFVAKFSPNGTHIWSENWFSTSTDWAKGIAIDARGDVAITGLFTGALDFARPRPTSQTLTPGYLSARNNDIFVTKLANGDGHTLWTSKVMRGTDPFGLGGGDADAGESVAFDRSGNVLVAGTVYNGNPGRVDLGGGPYTTGQQSQEAFLVKISGANGSYQWAKRLAQGNINFEWKAAYAVTADTNDNVTVVGFFRGTLNVGGGDMTSHGAGYDYYIANYSPTGAYRWSRQSANGLCCWAGATVDAATNDVVITGGFSGTADFGGSPMTSTGAAQDVFVARFRG